MLNALLKFQKLGGSESTECSPTRQNLTNLTRKYTHFNGECFQVRSKSKYTYKEVPRFFN